MNTGKESLFFNLVDIERSYLMAKALSSPVRLEILKLLIKNSMTMSELSHDLFLPMSSICMHCNNLKKANLITVTPRPGLHGSQKLCGIKVDEVTFNFFSSLRDYGTKPPKLTEIPIGSYSDCNITAPCGLVTSMSYINIEDTPHGFYDPNHVNASLLWFTTGSLIYHIPNKDIKDDDLAYVSISFEVCAEAPGYNNYWPSDIFIKINNTFITTFTVKGDYGGQKGANNPTWWSDSNTQYGELRELVIKNDGCYLNNQKVSSHNIESLELKDNYYFNFAIGVDKDSAHPGGINLFGRDFGNHRQDILIKAVYK